MIERRNDQQETFYVKNFSKETHFNFSDTLIVFLKASLKYVFEILLYGLQYKCLNNCSRSYFFWDCFLSISSLVFTLSLIYISRWASFIDINGTEGYFSTFDCFMNYFYKSHLSLDGIKLNLIENWNKIKMRH